MRIDELERTRRQRIVVDLLNVAEKLGIEDGDLSKRMGLEDNLVRQWRRGGIPSTVNLPRISAMTRELRQQARALKQEPATALPTDEHGRVGPDALVATLDLAHREIVDAIERSTSQLVRAIDRLVQAWNYSPPKFNTELVAPTVGSNGTVSKEL